jgi:hypothetical protein
LIEKQPAVAFGPCRLYFTFYNLYRIHGSLRVTQAMEAKLTDLVWELGDLLV